MGTGGLILWPLFGATNQLLAGLAFMVTVFYLWRRSKPVMFALLPMLAMLFMPAWALIHKMFVGDASFLAKDQYLLFCFGMGILGLQVWMVVEGVLMFPKAKGMLEEGLPPLPKTKLATSGGRSC